LGKNRATGSETRRGRENRPGGQKLQRFLGEKAALPFGFQGEYSAGGERERGGKGLSYIPTGSTENKKRLVKKGGGGKSRWEEMGRLGHFQMGGGLKGTNKKFHWQSIGTRGNRRPKEKKNPGRPPGAKKPRVKTLCPAELARRESRGNGENVGQAKSPLF